MIVDVKKYLKIKNPMVGGLVLKVTSPKGIRQFREETQQYHYHLHTETVFMYDDREDNLDTPLDLDAGLYWVVAICKNKDLGLHWNHYLFKTDGNSKSKIIGEYLNQQDSSWIVDALPDIKKNFK